MKGRGISTFAVSLVLAALFSASAQAAPFEGGGAAPATVRASAPEPVRIETHGVFTTVDSTAGTFTISGAVSDAGTYVDTFRLAGETLHVVKTLSGGAGTIALTAQGVVRWTSPTTATFFAGHWRVAAGTGAYADLKGGGHPGASGSANFATGAVDVVHEGSAKTD